MNSMMTLLPLILLFVVMYFLLIRPQKKRERETAAMRNSVRVGDEIITIGGIKGKIVKTKEESLVLQVGADKVKFEIMRWAVSKVENPSSEPMFEGEVSAESEDEEETSVKKSRPKRMRKAAPVEDEPAEEVAEKVEEVAEKAEEAPTEDAPESETDEAKEDK